MVKGKTKEGRRKKKGKKTKQMNANSQEPEGLVSKYWSQFRAHYIQGDSKRILALLLAWEGTTEAEVVPPRPPELILLLGRDPARYSLQRRGFAIRHVGWSFS